jgi:predicted SprT family Zn-dependent metalloprotease
MDCELAEFFSGRLCGGCAIHPATTDELRPSKGTRARFQASPPRHDNSMPFSSALVEVLGRHSANRLAAQAAKWSRQWGVPSLARDVAIDLNPRLRTAVARYRKEGEFVELGPRFLALRTRKAEVLAHELAHVAVTRLFGKTARPHGDEWRSLVRAVGFVPRIHLIPAGRKNTPFRKQRVAVDHYEHRCPVCQMVRIARRPVRQWQCSRCVDVGLSGTLTVSRVVQRI